MAQFLTYQDKDFEAQLDALLSSRTKLDETVKEEVSNIIKKVQQGGDDALQALTKQFDGFDLEPSSMCLTQDKIKDSVKICTKEERDLLALAARRIEAFHKRHIPTDDMFVDETGFQLGARWRAVKHVGLYVPGGLASYPSTVLMNGLPAKIAGVENIVMAMPTPSGKPNPLTLLAAHMVGVQTIYTIGGAQAIAALAYGTKTIHPVDVIVGPGNVYVAEAKRQVFGDVGIDMVAGPSEILVVADKTSNPHIIACDLLAQAEHDKKAQAILITDDEDFIGLVEEALRAQLDILPRKEIAKASWHDWGLVILVRDIPNDAPALIDRIAPEHLSLQLENPHRLADKITNAGAIFLGQYTPEVLGDYVAGPNHVLPTSGTARFASGLSVINFMKRSTVLCANQKAFLALAGFAEDFAEKEGLLAHKRSISMRLGKPVIDSEGESK